MRFLWMSLECFRVFFAFICFCSMIESAANENVVVVAMKNLFVVGDFAFDVFGKYSCFVAFVFLFNDSKCCKGSVLS